jgi:hypothetical protein
MRAIADGMAHSEASDVMRRLADDYDKLGDRAAERQATGRRPGAQQPDTR